MTNKTTPTETQLATIKALAEGTVRPPRSPLIRNPADYDMDYEDVFFPALDGVPLEAWFIPANSDRLIICNHPMTMNRYGYPGHLDPWKQFNDVEVDLNKIYKALHDAGYNVLSYDMRNSGRSGAAHGGVAGVGLFEWRDVVGASLYVQQHPALKAMKVGLFNPCAGGNAAMVAMHKRPELFSKVKAFVCAQPCSMNVAMHELAKLQGIGDFMEELDAEQIKLGGLRNAEMSPHPYAPSVPMPTYIIQVRDDFWTRPEDVQTTFDLLTVEDKKLFWIEGTNKRFDGYNYFGLHPETMVEFFDARF